MNEYGTESTQGEGSIKIYESYFKMDNVERPLRFIKFAMNSLMEKELR